MSDISPTQPAATVNDAGVLPLATPPVPLSPEQQARQLRLAVRIWCSFILVACAALLAVGFKLDPVHPGKYPGTGAHEQLGLPACGMLELSGYPCPTCGCTTAVSFFAHGHLIQSFLTQPFGFAVALLAALLVPLTLIGVTTGKWVGPSMFWINWHWQYWVFGGIGTLLLGWVYKIIIIRMGIAF